MVERMRLGLIGVGLMGHGLAASLLRSGFSLTFLDHPGNRDVTDLLEAGAVAAATPQAVAEASDAVLLCVSGSPQVADVLHRADGVLAGLKTGSFVIDFSTAMPDETLKEAAAVAAVGGRLVDAPMTRTPKEAEEGRLNLIVGGDPEAVDAVMPVLQAVGENIFRAGPVGTGHRLKLLHNFLALGNSALLAEAFACAAKGGVDLSTFCEVIRTGGANSTVFDRLQPYILKGDDSGFRFSVANAIKDVGYYVAMAEAAQSPASCAAAIQQLYDAANRQWSGEVGPNVPQLFDILGVRGK